MQRFVSRIILFPGAHGHHHTQAHIIHPGINRGCEAFGVDVYNLSPAFSTKQRRAIRRFITLGDHDGVFIFFQAIKHPGVTACRLGDISCRIIVCGRENLISIPDIPTVAVAARNIGAAAISCIAIFRNNMGHALGVVFIGENCFGIAAVSNNCFPIQSGVGFGQGITLFIPSIFRFVESPGI